MLESQLDAFRALSFAPVLLGHFGAGERFTRHQELFTEVAWRLGVRRVRNPRLDPTFRRYCRCSQYSRPPKDEYHRQSRHRARQCSQACYLITVELPKSVRLLRLHLGASRLSLPSFTSSILTAPHVRRFNHFQTQMKETNVAPPTARRW